MGLFDSDDDNPNDESAQLLNKQIAEAEAERQNKRNALYQTELDIVKSQGSPSWSPAAPTPRVKDRNNNSIF